MRTLLTSGIATILIAMGAPSPAHAVASPVIDVALRAQDGSFDPTLTATAWRLGQDAQGETWLRERTCTADVTAKVCRFSDLSEGTYVVDTGRWGATDGTTRTFHRAGSDGTTDGFAATRLSLSDDDRVTIALRQQKATASMSVKLAGISDSSGWAVLPQLRDPLRRDRGAEYTPMDMKIGPDLRFAGLPAGTYKMLAVPLSADATYFRTFFGDTPVEAEARTVSLTDGRAVSSTIRPLRKATVSVAVSGPDGTAADVSRVDLYARTVRGSAVTWERGPTASLDPSQDGRSLTATVRAVRPGTYRALVTTNGANRSEWYHDESDESKADEFDVAEGASVTLDPVQLSPAGPTARAASSTTVAAAPGGYRPGVPAAVTVRVSAAVAVAGRVEVLDGARVVGSRSIARAGSVSVPVGPLAAGRHLLRGRFLGSDDVRSSSSAAVAVPSRYAAAVSVRTAGSAIAGRAPILTVAVRGTGTIAGTVTVKEAGSVVGRATLAPSARGLARVRLRPRAAGAHTLAVEYGGSTTVAAARATSRLVVAKATPSVRASSTRLKARRAGRIIVRVGAAGLVPSGRVTVKAGGRVVGRATLATNARGRVSVKVAGLPRGRRTLTIVYAGDRQTAARTIRVVVRVR